jgi:hypothetical protein
MLVTEYLDQGLGQSPHSVVCENTSHIFRFVALTLQENWNLLYATVQTVV